MSLLNVLSITVGVFCGISLAFAENTVQVVYQHSPHQHEARIAKNIKMSGVAEEVAAFINGKFSLSKPLVIKFGGIDGPLYDTHSNEIFIPYTFIKQVQNRFESANYSETGVSVTDATLDSVMHTLFHEFAHALIFTYKLPVVGKEEDAADALANVLLIEFFDNGSDIVISAADLFDLESDDIEEFEAEDFWGEHSLDAQRFYSALCYVYGSDPKKYTYLLQDIGFSDERADLCIDEYESILRSWLRLLEPYFKHSG